jgi:hypothetical protein
VHENALKESLQKHACSMTGGAQPRWVLHHHVDDMAAQPMQRRILRSLKTNLQDNQSINQSRISPFRTIASTLNPKP